VEVVFHAEKKRLDARTASQIARRVRAAIDSADDERFPILSFIADSEMKKVKPAAA
jgi:hypothetical protein